MARTDLTIPSLGDKFIDLRDQLPGDAYNWNWERDLAQVNYLTLHHTAAADDQTPLQIANDHISKNGWGGIGYHFLIAKDGSVFYVGDILTARANVANLNEQVIGIGLIGNFVSGQVPTQQQLDSTHKLCEFLLSLTDLANVKSWDKVRGHKELPSQSTTCPGDDWSDWRIQIVEGITPTPPPPSDQEAQNTILQSQVDSLQTSLASVNQQAISLTESLQEREQEVRKLKQSLVEGDTTLTIIQALVNLYKFISPPREV